MKLHIDESAWHLSLLGTCLCSAEFRPTPLIDAAYNCANRRDRNRRRRENRSDKPIVTW